MNIQEAIDLVDRLKPNQYDTERKVKWLSKLDGMIWREVLLTHEGCKVTDFHGYDEAHPHAELLVPFPYDEDIYNYFLQMQIDKENGEMNKYNQAAALYNAAYKTFCDWYNRTHRSVPAESRFLF